MIIHNPILTGSFTVNGTDVASITSSAASIASLNSYTASLNARSSSFATTGSNTFVGNQVVSGSLTVTGSITTPGTLTAQTLVVQTITSSVDFVTGSTRFGSLSSNTHVFTGSMSVSGSITSNGAFSGTSATLSGDLTIDTNTLYVDSTNNRVNIGTTTGVGKLYIAGTDTTSIGDRATAALVLNNLNGTANGRVNAILFGGETGNTNSAAAIAFKYTSGTGNGLGDLIFATRDVTTDTAPTTRLTISSTGAATFSSSVTAVGLASTGTNHLYNGVELRLYNANNTNWGTIKGSTGTTFGTISITGGSGNGIFVDNGGNVGIGTTDASSRLRVEGGELRVTTSNAGVAAYYSLGNGEVAAYNWGGGAWIPLVYGGSEHRWNTSGTERMRITSGGLVGIGTTSPNHILNVAQSNSADLTNVSFDNTAGAPTNAGTQGTILRLKAASSDNVVRTMGAIASYAMKSTGAGANNNGDLRFYTGAEGDTIERMRITSGGNVCVGGTNENPAVNATNGIALRNDFLISVNRNNDVGLDIGRNGTDGAVVSFRRGATQVGTISVTGSATAYNTSSDYRLKTDFKDYNGLDIISKIKSYDFAWKSDNTRMYGVIAHELQEILGYAVVGEKDGVDMQGVDYSKLTPILIKAIQELTARVQQLENK